jgi:tetrahydromethanopterin S-methyltransferase subunit D
MTDATPTDGKKEAVQTYLEQTKLLVTLSSAFILAPAGLVAVLKERSSVGLANSQLFWFVVAEVLFIASVLAGYVVLGTIAGFQDAQKFDVYRPATRYASLIQIAAYLSGLSVFIYLAFTLAASTPVTPPKP